MQSMRSFHATLAYRIFPVLRPAVAVVTVAIVWACAGHAPPDRAASAGEAAVYTEPPVEPYDRFFADSAAAVLDRLGWMAGCWERRTAGRHAEEHWMAPRGGTMLGMSRTVRDGRTVEYEVLRIEVREGRLVYVASPSRQATTEFTGTATSDTLAAFENPAHDFPQRILYRRGGADSLWARIEGDIDGQRRAVDFRMGRSECG